MSQKYSNTDCNLTSSNTEHGTICMRYFANPAKKSKSAYILAEAGFGPDL